VEIEKLVLINVEGRIEVWDEERRCKIMIVTFWFGRWAGWQFVQRDMKNPFMRWKMKIGIMKWWRMKETIIITSLLKKVWRECGEIIEEDWINVEEEIDVDWWKRGNKGVEWGKKMQDHDC
jgi:hypothetical protein